jgi:hypothetical protein
MDTAVPLCEEVLHNAKLVKLRKSNVRPEHIKEIEKDLAWPKDAKVMVAKTGANLGAKYLNQVGLSAAYKDEVNFGMALLVILRAEAQVNARLDKIIAAAEPKSAPPHSASAVPAAATSSPAIKAGASFPTEMRPDENNPTKKK